MARQRASHALHCRRPGLTSHRRPGPSPALLPGPLSRAILRLLPWKNTLSLPFPRLAGKLILVLRLCLRTSILPVLGNISPGPPYVRDRKRLFPQCREPCLFVRNSP
ncbi:hypothetical protein DESPIG_00004 [Desulfovibrio piger ATCC 29098]|uniref:Uncharacterized protein n=1 Tax=Desulfovibrio piger ATCC 29098 TaxID=411464 RepID=B6WPN8_9BACT|nr:hypothetical protein DESPIG_00004 [Desulfovibrio piger ATCC 29098]